MHDRGTIDLTALRLEGSQWRAEDPLIGHDAKTDTRGALDMPFFDAQAIFRVVMTFDERLR
ncbi:hypothetical protein D3C85_1754650 [compost metagenome]